MTPLPEILRKERILLGPEALGLPEIRMLGRLNYSRAHQPLRIHDHPGCMEICFLSKGRQSYFVGPREYALAGGDLFLTFPDEKHSTGRRPEEKSILYWLIVDLSRGSGPFLGLVPDQARELRKGLLSLKTRLFRGGAALRDILDDLIALAHGAEVPLQGLRMRNKLVDFLLQVIYYGRKKAAPEALHPLKAVLDRIHGRLEEKLSVTDLAALAGLSVSRFKAKFKRIMGMPPGEYMLRRKVERAQELLGQGGSSVTSVAFDLDFSSSQYFATVFKRYTGKNPGSFLGRKKGQSA